MTASLIDGKDLAANIRAEIAKEARSLASQGMTPGLAVILVGADPASEVYVRNKAAACQAAGMLSRELRLAQDIAESELLRHIEQLNHDRAIHGILVQLPLPDHIDTARVIQAIDPTKDVDGFHAQNAGLLMTGQPKLLPCTPYGVMRLLEHIACPIRGAEAVVVGASNIVGKPMALLLQAAGATVTICNSKTRDLAAHTARADILVVATGKPGMISGAMIKPGAVVIDVGISRLADGSLAGDVDFASAKEVAGAITPVPGGVGPMTIAMLLANTLQAAKDTNPLLVAADQAMAYQLVRAEHIEPAIRELIQAARSAIETAAACQDAPSWENLIEQIETPSEQLQRAWSVAGHLNSVVNTPELRAALNACLPLVSEFYTWVGQNQNLYARYQKFAAATDFAALAPVRQRIIELALRGFRLSGVQLQGEARAEFARNSEQQSQAAQKFSENVLDATDGWHLDLPDDARLAGVPADVIAAARAAASAAGQDGLRLGLQMPCYLPLMQHARDRELRQSLYRAYVTRASDQGDAAFDNSATMEELLALRAREASLLGYADFASLSLETRMAESPAQVLEFLRDLAARARPSAARDLAQLQDFAREKLGIDALQAWDIAYASERLREERYAYSEEELRPYFTEERVLQGLFDIIQRLFGVRLQLCDTPAWHPDARIYQVLDKNGQELGRLGMDLYARAGKQGGAWVDSERNRRLYHGKLHTPLAWLTCNFAAPQNGRPALWTHDDLITLFHESGHAMHTLLSRVDDPGAAAFAAVEWDAIELPSQFMENFCWEWPVLQALSSHVDSGAPLPRDLYERMLAARNFQSGLQTLRQVEFALFDMLIHQQAHGLSIEQIMACLAEVRAEVALLQPPAWNRFAHSFSHLFAGGYAAGYYSYKWAEVLSADAFAAFEEAATPLPDGSRDVFNAAVGQRYLDEIIAVGGARPAAESFRAFRGRDPQIDALLAHSGLLQPQ